MGEGLVPSDILAFSDPHLAPNGVTVPLWRNFMENPAAVQFTHRWMVCLFFGKLAIA